jgi:hypothetical protein
MDRPQANPFVRLFKYVVDNDLDIKLGTEWDVLASINHMIESQDIEVTDELVDILVDIAAFESQTSGP